MKSRSIGFCCIIFPALWFQAWTPLSYTQYAPSAPEYYVCAEIKPSGYRVCTIASFHAYWKAVTMRFQWLRAQVFYRVVVVRGATDRKAWLQQSPRCHWQEGGNCA